VEQAAAKEAETLREQLDARIESAESEKSELKKMFAAASQETKKSKQQIEQLGARIESVENERSELKQQYARLQQLAAEELEKAVKESRAESERLNKQLQAAQEKADSASDSNRIVHVLYRQSVKERAQVEQAAAKEAEALRAQLAMSKQQIADAQAEAKTARAELAERIEKLISAAAALTVNEVSGLKDKLAAANSEIIVRLKAVRAEK
jgi:chromosome segregation ATPase